MKAIIMYYSRKGRTEQLAKNVQSALGCDIMKVEPDKPFGNFVSVLHREAHDRKKSEEATGAATEVPDLSAYDVVFVGYPIWQTEMPEFLAQFLERCDFSGKAVVPFATCSSTGIKPSLKRLKLVIGADATVLYPFCFGAAHHDDFGMWMDKVKALDEQTLHDLLADDAAANTDENASS